MAYSRYTKDKFEFDGDEIEVTFKRLKRTQFMELKPFFDTDEKEGTVSMQFSLMDDNGNEISLMSYVEEIVKDNLIYLSGLTTEDGYYHYNKEHATEEQKEEMLELLDELYYTELLQSILISMINASVAVKGKQDEKKSGKESKESCQESEGAHTPS